MSDSTATAVDRTLAELARVQAERDRLKAENDEMRSLISEGIDEAKQHLAAMEAALRESEALLVSKFEPIVRVFEAAVTWRDTWRHRHPFGEESKAVALVDAIDAARPLETK